MTTALLSGSHPRLRAAALPRWTLLVVVTALVQQAFSALNCDVSWLITVAERTLDGATLYRDIEEVNPPASVLLYVPPVVIARWLALPPEPITVALVTLIAGLSIVQTARILPVAPGQRDLLAAAAAFALLVLPADLFAQREHVALIAALPMIAILAARAQSLPVAPTNAWSAGLAAGITVAIKPHFALALLFVASWAIVRHRSLRPVIGAEWIMLGLTAVGYALIVQLAFPLYLDRMLPLLRLVYLPDRDSWRHLLTGHMTLIPAVCAVLTLWLARGRPAPATVATLFAAAGFVAAGLVQGKGYLNHGYPGIALALLAITLELTRAGHARRLGLFCGALLALISTVAYARVSTPDALRDAVVRHAPLHPRLIGISFDFALGHPLTRWVDGRWVGTRGDLWVTGNTRQPLADPALPPERRTAIVKAARDDAALLAADIMRGRPDMVLVDDDPGPDWIAANPPVARAMRAYRPVERVGTVTFWKRR